jgi:cbb3-type cytochrome oxidase subunit 3
MMTLLTTLVSFLAGGVPKILSAWQDRQDKKHELALLQMQKERELELLAKGYAAQAQIEEIKTEQVAIQAAAEERVALYAHDMKIGEGASQWVINLRASVRPVVTYLFVLLLIIVDVAGIWYAYTKGVDFAVAMENVFSDDEMTILSSIIAFWFGTQAFGKK